MFMSLCGLSFRKRHTAFQLPGASTSVSSLSWEWLSSTASGKFFFTSSISALLMTLESKCFGDGAPKPEGGPAEFTSAGGAVLPRKMRCEGHQHDGSHTGGREERER